MKILFISHDAFRTGAPLVLLQLLKWIKKARPNIQFEVLLRQGGPLEEEFKKIAPTYSWPLSNTKSNFFSIKKFLKKIFAGIKISNHQDILLKKIEEKQYDLIYANTVASSDVVSKILRGIHKRPVLFLHIHELEAAIELYCNRSEFEKVIPQIDHFIAISKVVEDNLVNKYKISTDKISLVHSFSWASLSVTHTDQSLKKKFGIPSSAFVVGASGTLEWRKGPDIFVQVARQVILHEEQNRPIYFLWMGGWFEEKYRLQIQYDIDALGLNERVLLIGAKENPADYFNLFDVFFLPSREDPFPLVVVENAMMGNPVICFNHQLGSAEFIDDNCGKVLDYLDIKAAGISILEFYKDNEKLKMAGRIIKERMSGFTVENQGSSIISLIEKKISSEVS